MAHLEEIDRLFTALESKDDPIRYDAFKKLLSITVKHVPWIYDKWYSLVEKLSSENSFIRNIGIILLANLAKSDYENRFGPFLDTYLDFFEDEKFITSRQCLQHVWKIAVCNRLNRDKIINNLEESYTSNLFLNRHPKLIKQDIIGSLFRIYQDNRDESLRVRINNLIDSETDDKLNKVLKKIVES